jgi:hypothetical protein
LGVWGFAPNSENQNAQAFWFGIPAVFRLQVFALQKPGNLFTPASVPLRLLRKQLAAPAIATRGGLRHWILPQAAQKMPQYGIDALRAYRISNKNSRETPCYSAVNLLFSIPSYPVV